MITSAYRNYSFSKADGFSNGVEVATARAGNVVGGGDWAEDRLVPDMMTALMKDRPIILRYPEAVRHWKHVLEPLDGYLSLAEKLWEEGPKFGEGLNFGPRREDARPVS